MAELATAYLTLVPSLKGAQGQIERQLKGMGLNKVGTDLGGSAGTSMGKAMAVKVGEGLLGAGGKIASTLVKPVVAGVASVGTAVTGLAATGGIGRALKLEQAKFMLKGLGYEGENLTKVMDSATAAVSGTAFGLDSAATAASLLAASGIDIDTQLDPALRAVTGLAAMTGSSMEEIADIMATVAANGKVSGDELNRLSARGINAATVLGDALGKTSEEIRKMVSRGEIDFDTFANAMNEKFGEAAYGANETFSGAMANVRAALSRVGQAFAEPALQNLTKVFAAMIPAINAVNKALAPAAKAFTDIANVVGGQAVKAFNNFAENVKGGMGVVEAISALFSDLNVAVDTMARAMVSSFRDGLPRVIEAISAMAGPLMSASVELFAGLMKALSAAIEEMKPMIDDMVRGFGAWLVENGPVLAGAALQLFGSIVTALLIVVVTVLEDMGGLAAAACGAIAGAAGMMLSAADEFFDGIEEAVTGAITGALAAVGSLVTSIVSRVSGAAGELAAAAGNMVQGMVQGIFNGADSVIAAIRRVCDDALEAVKSFFGIASPSRVMRRMFGYVGEGMALGLADAESDVVGAMEDVIDGAYGAAAGFSPTLSMSADGAAAGMLPGGTVYNVYVNGAVVNSDDAIQTSMYDFLTSLQRRAAM